MQLKDLIDTNSTTNIIGITADSREVKQGFLFASLNDDIYISDAIKKGAAAVIIGHNSLVESESQVEIIRCDNPAKVYAAAVARYYQYMPEHLAAITGTNGKTSIADFTRQMLTMLGAKSASIGTLGVIKGNDAPIPLPNTTPNNVTLHQILRNLSEENFNYAILEASSHGLEQQRLGGVEFDAAGFTNLTRDHLDYHKTFENYFAAKLILFSERLKKGGIAVLNADIEQFSTLKAICEKRGCQVWAYGYNGDVLKLLKSTPSVSGQTLDIEYFGTPARLTIPLAGDFQAMNVLCALGLTAALSGKRRELLPLAEKIKGAKGRLELVGHTANGAAVYIDYAHTPDALENVLRSLREHTTNHLIVVFGCGGNRDKGKRPIMGQIANDLADIVYVTDDNPRMEDADIIRQEIMAACPKGINIKGRAEAIKEAISQAQKGDVIVLAGKGHESGQYVNGEVLPFSDHEEALKNLS